MTADRLRLRIAELVQDSADGHATAEPNAEMLGAALGAVLDRLDRRAVRVLRDGDPMVFAADIRDVIADRLGVERDM